MGQGGKRIILKNAKLVEKKLEAYSQTGDTAPGLIQSSGSKRTHIQLDVTGNSPINLFSIGASQQLIGTISGSYAVNAHVT
eukprot:1467083-Amphidinium_carterae.1